MFGDPTGSPTNTVTPSPTPSATPVPCQPQITRIMPLGDSITLGYGSANLDGYRRELYRSLISAGYPVDFVGSQLNGPDDFDRDHEGHPGWQAEGGDSGGIAPNVFGWLTSNKADIVLLHIGTNDISNNNQSPVKVAHILDEIDRYDRNITVILALIVNRRDYSPATSQFNQDVQAMAMDRISKGDKIVIVDMEHALNYPDDIKDWTHPNETGYSKMAKVWMNALTGLLPKCSNAPQ